MYVVQGVEVSKFKLCRKREEGKKEGEGRFKLYILLYLHQLQTKSSFPHTRFTSTLSQSGVSWRK